MKVLKMKILRPKLKKITPPKPTVPKNFIWPSWNFAEALWILKQLHIHPLHQNSVWRNYGKWQMKIPEIISKSGQWMDDCFSMNKQMLLHGKICCMETYLQKGFTFTRLNQRLSQCLFLQK